MLMSHKVIDCLNGIGKENLILPPDVDKQDLEYFALVINNAEKFDFGEINFEKENEKNIFLDKFTDDEIEAFKIGLIPLPYPVVWYEFSSDKKRSGLLIHQFDNNDYFIGNKIITEKQMNALPLSSIYSRRPLGDDSKPLPNDQKYVWCVTRFNFEKATDRTWEDNLFFSGASSYVSDYNEFNVAVVFKKETEKFIIEYFGKNSVEIYKEYLLAGPHFAHYLTLMLNSKTTEKHYEKSPDRLNKIRIKQKKCPLHSHTIVNIVPEIYIRQALEEAGRTHKSPRLHWRRSHLRVIGRGTQREYKVVIPRCLIGKSELGSITHEYRVKT